MVNYGGGNDKILVSPSGDTTGAADWTRITNAMTAAGPAGGTVGFEPGIYYVNAPLKWDTTAKTTIQLAPSLVGAPGIPGPSPDAGANTGSVQITAASSFPVGEFMIDYLGPAPGGGAGGNTGFTISGLSLQCASKAAGIRSFNSEDSTWENLVVVNPATPNPANTDGTPSAAISFVASPSYEAFNNHCVRCYVYGAAQDAYQFGEGTGSYVTVSRCAAVNATRYGYVAQDLTTLQGCIAQGSGQADWQVWGATLTGCVSFNASPTQNAVQLVGGSARSARITGCYFIGTNTAAQTEEQSAIFSIHNQAQAAVVDGCFFVTGTHTSDYVYVESGATGAVLFSNCYFDSTHAGGGALTNTAYNANGSTVLQFANCIGINDVSLAYDRQVLADSPAVWWKLADASGASTAADSSGNSNTGTAANVTFAVPGPVTGNATETAGLFNGTSSTITSTWQPATPAAFTIEAWVNMRGATPSGSPRIAANSHPDGDSKGFQLMLNLSTSQWFPEVFFGNGSASQSAQAPIALPTSGWHHIAATFGTGTIRLYVDGIQVATASLTGPLGTGAAGGLGAGFNPAYSGDYLAGMIGQVAGYTTALSAARILAHYQAGAYS
jgi:Concanavalin A-like lectin/glucanases superfamily